MDEIKELIRKVENFAKNEQCQEIIDLLPDTVLDRYRNADLYAWRAFAHNNFDDSEKTFEYADKAITIDPKNYLGYRQRGNAWNIKKEYDKALADYSKAIELKKDDALAYSNRGLVWFYKKEYDKALTEYAKAIELEKNDAYIYFNRALVWGIKKKLDKAIADYSRAIDIKKDYQDAYTNRGVSWHNMGDIDKAIKDYNSALELKETSLTYTNRGIAWCTKGEFDKGIKDYDKAIKLQGDYANAFRNRGLAFYEKGDFERALEDFEEAISIDKSFVFLDYNIKLTKEKLEERKKLEASNAKPNDIADKIRIEENIDKAINIILAAATSEVKTVVHYTKVSVADIYVKTMEANDRHEWARMHYSNAIYMNDPLEGKVFFEYLDNPAIEEAYCNGEKRTETSVYLGSFLPAEENDGAISHEDELVMWRTYGKDENSKEAAGCSIVLDSNFFKNKNSKKGEISSRDSYDEQLLNVVYIKKLRNKKEITNDSKTKIAPAIADLKRQLIRLLKLRENSNYSKTHEFYKDIENTIFKKLSVITYLFKSADYEFEHEVRVIIYMPRDSDLVKHRPNGEGNVPSKRFYIESYNYILPSIKKIYLGPKVENYQQWSLYLDYEIRQRAKEQPNTIKPAEIEIIKSVCKFQ